MTETQEYLLKLLEEIDDICVTNSIDYYIFAGSMLGVERNEGFLPWDDDIDIVMTKKNYDKFCEVIKSLNIKDRAFVCKDNNSDYPLHFGKYMSTTTSHLIRSLAFGNCSAGIWIDIMFVVPLPEKKKELNFVKRWFPVFCEIENEHYVEYRNHYDGFWPRYSLMKAWCTLFGRKRVLNYFKHKLTSCPEDECENYYLFHSLGSDLRVFSKSFFGKPIRREYEGLQVNVSPLNTSLCRAGYGDGWMMVPDEKDQEQHLVVQDFDIPYYKYKEDYMCFLDSNEVQNIIKKTKNLDLKNDIKRKKYYKEKYLIKAVLMEAELRKKLKENGYTASYLINNNMYEEIDKIYINYLTAQFSVGFMWWKVFIPISDINLYTILFKLICRDGMYYSANKILDLRKMDTKNVLSEELLEIDIIIKILRQISIAIWDNNDSEMAVKLIDEAEAILENKKCIDIDICKVHIELMKTNEVEKLKELKERCIDCIKEYGERGEFYKFLGDIEFKLGEYNLAITYYEKAKTSLKNGLLLLSLDKNERIIKSAK